MGESKIDHAVKLAGSEHRYQHIVAVFFSIVLTVVYIIYQVPTYVFMQPAFRCQKNPSYKFHQVEACEMINQCEIREDFTLTAEMGLYCDMGTTLVLLQSIYPLGSFIGSFVVNLVSDTKGRKIGFYVALSIVILGMTSILFGGVSGNVVFLFIGNFAAGFGCEPMISMGYALLYDFFSDQFRPVAVVIANSVAGLSSILLGVAFLMEINWFNFIIFFIFIPSVLLIFFVAAFLEESPYILMERNMRQEAFSALENIAQMNGFESNIDEIQKIIENESEKLEKNEASVKNVYKTIRKWKYLKQILLLTAIYGIAYLNFFGVGYSYEEQGLGFGYNCIAVGILQMVVFIVVRWTVENVPRRLGMALSSVSILVIGLCFLFPGIKGNHIFPTLLIVLSKLASYIGYSLVSCLQTETFTSRIQSTANGLICGFGLYGAMIAPKIINVAFQIGIDPMTMVGFFSLFTLIPVYFLKQTFPAESSTVVEPNKLQKEIEENSSQDSD